MQMGERELISLIKSVWGEDVRFRVLKELANREGATMRELARRVGISHKNLAKYLQALNEKGVIDFFEPGSKARVYRLSQRWAFLAELLR